MWSLLVAFGARDRQVKIKMKITIKAKKAMFVDTSMTHLLCITRTSIRSTMGITL